MTTNTDRWVEFRQELVKALDFTKIYKDFGCTPLGSTNAAGYIRCKSHPKFGGEDNNPSASFNIRTGIYTDFRANGKSLSIWDFMVEIGEAEDWRSAQKKLAEQINLKPPNKSKNDPDHGVEWEEWMDIKALPFTRIKIPITIEGLRASRARMCRWNGEDCFAWDILDEGLQIIGYHFMPRSGRPFVFDKTGAAKTITKKFPGHSGGFIGRPAITEMLIKGLPNLFWTEGVSDLLTLYSKWPDAKFFVTNPNGCQEGVSEIYQRTLQEAINPKPKVFLLGDRDNPGVLGAIKRHQSLLDLGLKSEIWIPTGPVAEKHGQDIRDLVQAHWDELTDPLQILDHMVRQDQHENIQIFKAQANQQAEQTIKAQTDVARKCLVDLGLQIIESDITGRFTIDCRFTQKRRTFPRIGDVTYLEMIAILGSKFSMHVIDKDEETALNQGKISFSTFKERLSMLLSTMKNTSVDTVGEGIWMLTDSPDSNNRGDLYLVSNGRFNRFKNGQLELLDNVIERNTIIDLNNSREWFDRDLLGKYCSLAGDLPWRQEVHKQVFDIVSSWRWSYEQMDMLACSLIYVTWLQTMLPWKPTVTITGESSSGKTLFLKVLEDLYLGTAMAQARSTEAGILQRVGYSGTPLFLDEFDSGRDQKQILAALRANSRGQETNKGTPDQRGKRYRLRHIPWISGIFALSKEQADNNRMISLELSSLPRNHRLNIPSKEKAYDLGHRILAAVLLSAHRTLELLDQLSNTGEMHQPDSARYHESYNVPFAMLGGMLGINTDILIEARRQYFEEHLVPSILVKGGGPDQEAALLEIMHSTIPLPLGAPTKQATVAQVLTSQHYLAYIGELESYGISLKVSRSGQSYVAIYIPQLTMPGGLLSRSEVWANHAGLKQVLPRLKKSLKAEFKPCHIAGATRSCLTIPYSNLQAWLLGEGSNVAAVA